MAGGTDDQRDGRTGGTTDRRTAGRRDDRRGGRPEGRTDGMTDEGKSGEEELSTQHGIIWQLNLFLLPP